MTFICVEDFQRKAYAVIKKDALDYYRSGAGDEDSLKLNCEAFKRLRIRPRCLRDVSQMDLKCEILGCQLEWPVGIAPTAMQKMAHPDGERGTACAAGNLGSIFIMSTLSTTSMEDIATAAPNTCKWFQLYIYKDRSITQNLLRRVEACGFKAIVLTIDAPIFGIRRSDVRNNFSLPPHLCLANFDGFQSNGVLSKIGTSGINEYVSSQFDASVTWQDLSWLAQQTHLPIIVKGVLTREDAILAREFGCAGVVVSNHGARQLDSVPAPIEVLPEIVSAVGQDLIVMLDSGIRQGTDIFKALALGAKYCFVGRPAIWGLACDGQRGVEDILTVLKNEFRIALALTGCRNLSDISRTMIAHESSYAKL